MFGSINRVDFHVVREPKKLVLPYMISSRASRVGILLGYAGTVLVFMIGDLSGFRGRRSILANSCPGDSARRLFKLYRADYSPRDKPSKVQ